MNKEGILQGQTILRGDPLRLCLEDWLMEDCEMTHVLADGFRHGEVVRGNMPWLRFDRRAFPNLKEPSRRIQTKSI
jgi:hypothetical protein